MKQTPWDLFFHQAVERMCLPGTRVLDIGGGLRVDGTRGNVEDVTRAWIKPYLDKLTYEVMDPVDTYHPDIVGDIHAMPMADGTYDSVICLAVLEHVPRPWVAVQEMRRILKGGGRLFLYTPFLSPYHAMPGYYGDFFRYTDDGLRALLADGWTDVELMGVRGPVETIVHLLPKPFSSSVMRAFGRWIDTLRHASGKQTSGYFLTAKRVSS